MTTSERRFEGLELDDAGGRVTALKSYLYRYGYLQSMAQSGAPDVFDRELADALARLQRLRGFQPRALVDAGLADYLAQPRCGAPDLIWFGPVAVRPLAYRGWPTKRISYNIHNAPRHWVGNRTEFAPAIEWALNEWATAAGLTFERRDDQADMIFSFKCGDHGDGSQNAFDGPDGHVYAHAFPPPADATASSFAGDVHFDDDDRWAASPAKRDAPRNLRVMALHEIGHALGLVHSNDSGSIMQPCYADMVDVGALGDEDLRLIKVLYP